ncbi:hypothetical protein [Maioricimonas rarisocia]|nr:hypothetical protein [Maioricimonas rarisocia]
MTQAQFVGSIALIRRWFGEKERWLARWDERAQVLDFVHAERLEGESYRESIDREVAWTLDLQRKRDYIVSSAPRLHFQAPLEIPGQCTPVFFVVQFFVVDLYGQQAARTIDADDRNQWCRPAELKAGQSADGRAIAPGLHALLARTEAIPSHGE